MAKKKAAKKAKAKGDRWHHKTRASIFARIPLGDEELAEFDLETEGSAFRFVEEGNNLINFCHDFATEKERDAFLLGFEVATEIRHSNSSESFFDGLLAGLQLCGKRKLVNRLQSGSAVGLGISPADKKRLVEAFAYGMTISEDAQQLDVHDIEGDVERQMMLQADIKEVAGF